MPTRVRSIIDNSRVPEPNIGRMREVEDYRELDSQAAMERAACNIIYLDKTAREEIVRRPSTSSASGPRTSSGSDLLDYSKADSGQHQAEIQTTLESILSTFSTGKHRSRGNTPTKRKVRPNLTLRSACLSFRWIMSLQTVGIAGFSQRQHPYHLAHRRAL
jgi:hypothetical protein